jgi:archaemetzincin
MERILFFTAFLLTFSAGPAVKFKPPTPKERLQAIGSTDELSKTLSRALVPTSDFEPIPTPKPGDWLAVHRETGQTFDAFVKSKPNRPTKIRSNIYLQPLGQFPKAQLPLVQTLTEYAAAYFTMQMELLPSLALSDSNVTTRINQFTKNRQILTADVLAILKKNLPADAFCLLAITMEDLYPEPSWNFVFGQASFRERVGVYSFARYDPAFYGEKRGKDYEKIILRRSCRVLAHETAHMFGLKHCIYFRCVLNGSNHLQESDARPLHFCPVCLRKLQHSIRFDVVTRYHRLRKFSQKAAFNDETRWLTNRLEWITGKTEQKNKISR